MREKKGVAGVLGGRNGVMSARLKRIRGRSLEGNERGKPPVQPSKETGLYKRLCNDQATVAEK